MTEDVVIREVGLRDPHQIKIEQDRRLIALWRRGVSMEELAKGLHVTTSAMKGRVQRAIKKEESGIRSPIELAIDSYVHLGDNYLALVWLRFKQGFMPTRSRLFKFWHPRGAVWQLEHLVDELREEGDHVTAIRIERILNDYMGFHP